MSSKGNAQNQINCLKGDFNTLEVIFLKETCNVNFKSIELTKGSVAMSCLSLRLAAQAFLAATGIKQMNL